MSAAQSFAALPYQAASRELDAAERERLLLEHLPVVRGIARRIHERLPAQVALEDLVQAGVMGLIDALHKYDPAHNAQLGTYARFRIRGAILDSLRAQDWGTRELRRRGRALREAERALEGQLGRAPAAAETAAALGLSLEAYHELAARLHGLAAEEPDEEGTAIEAAASPAPSPYELCRQDETRRLLTEMLEELPERERQILSLYYFEELTMKEVGAVLGIGESRISQIHSGLLRQLRERLRQRLGAPALAGTAAGALLE